MEIKVYDMLVFEDKDGNIYQDCVCIIKERSFYFEIECNSFDINMTEDFNKITGVSARNVLDKKAGCYKGYRNDLKLKEIWTRTDENTYKKVWENR